ncbi:MAG: type II toxin-antitoxin system Phd/YefM family antitoxin [Deltaproteobacteria bacterium]|nr:type II toxin-antitoxin system Phd/YefM family antitoxin [Deltaproteobacteria bacterium]
MAKRETGAELRPLTDLQSCPLEIVRQARRTGRPVLLTRRGRGVAVMVSADRFAELEKAAEQLRLQRAVEQAEHEIAAGEYVPHRAVARQLRGWARGGA